MRSYRPKKGIVTENQSRSGSKSLCQFSSERSEIESTWAPGLWVQVYSISDLSDENWPSDFDPLWLIYDATNVETRVTLSYPLITFVFLLEPSRFSLGLLLAPSTFVRAGSVFCLLLGFSTSCCLPWTLPTRSLGEPSTEGFALPWFLPSCSLEELSVVPEDVDGFFLLLLNLPRKVNSEKYICPILCWNWPE